MSFCVSTLHDLYTRSTQNLSIQAIYNNRVVNAAHIVPSSYSTSNCRTLKGRDKQQLPCFSYYLHAFLLW